MVRATLYHLPDFCLLMPRTVGALIKLITAHTDCRARKKNGENILVSKIDLLVNPDENLVNGYLKERIIPKSNHQNMDGVWKYHL